GSPGIRASAAPPAGLAAPGPASSAPISSPPALPAWGSPYISVSSTCPEGSRRLPPRCLFSASALPSPVLFFSVLSAVSGSSALNSFFFLPNLLRLTPSLESLPLYFLSSSLPLPAPIPPLALLRGQPRIPRLSHRRAKNIQ